jgi:hypothetical protein
MRGGQLRPLPPPRVQLAQGRKGLSAVGTASLKANRQMAGLGGLREHREPDQSFEARPLTRRRAARPNTPMGLKHRFRGLPNVVHHQKILWTTVAGRFDCLSIRVGPRQIIVSQRTGR